MTLAMERHQCGVTGGSEVDVTYKDQPSAAATDQRLMEHCISNDTANITRRISVVRGARRPVDGLGRLPVAPRTGDNSDTPLSCGRGNTQHQSDV